MALLTLPPSETWNPEIQKEFLRSSLKYLQTKAPDLNRRVYIAARYDTKRGLVFEWRLTQTLIDWVYKLGKDYGLLRMAHDEFCSWVSSQHGCPKNPGRGYYPRYGLRWPRCYRGRDDIWYLAHNVSFREKMSGKRNVSAKKSISEIDQNRRSWREQRGFSKDRSKCKRWGKARKGFAKKLSNRDHRSWEKRQIQIGDWDSMIGDIRKWTHDSWMWD